MLLLFWHAEAGVLLGGSPFSIRWYHSTGFPPRYICGTDLGVSIINPYYPSGSDIECSYAILDKQCNSVDIYNGDLVIGTQSGGLYRAEWSTIASKSLSIGNPEDFSTSVSGFTTFSGLLSDTILSVEANGEYLGIVTSSGFCYGRPGETEYLSYVTESGKDCFVREDNYVYLAEGNRILCKSSPGDFGTWDRELNFSYEINDIWVNSKEGIDTVFVATANGPYVIQGDSTYDYTSVISGSKNTVSVAVEYDSNYNWGHLFTASSGVVNIINLKSKELESTIPYGGSVLFAAEHQRLYSK